MLECGGDTTWMLTMLVASPGAGRRNRKWRPFGSRRRRQQGRRGMKRNIPNTPVKLPQYRPRHRASDNDTIQRMIANLPAKRSTRRVIQFNEDEIKTRSQGTIHSVSFAPTFTRQNYKSGGGRLAYSRTSLSSGAGELPSSKDKKRLKHLRRKAAVAAMLAVTGSSSTSNPKKPDGAGAVTRAQLSSGLSTGIELSVSSTQKLDGTTPNPKPKQESVVEKKVVKLGGKAVSPIKKSNKSSLVNSTSTVETEDDKTSPGKSLSLARGRSTKRLCTVAEIRSSSTGSNSKIEKIKKNVKRSVSLDQKKVTKKFISTNSPITVSSPPESNAIGVKKKIGKSLGITKSKSSGSKTRSGSSPANAIPNVTDSEVPVENHNEATVDVVTVNENETSNILAAMRLAMMESTKTAKKPYTTEDVSKNKPSSVKRTRSRISVEGETAEKVTKKPKMSQVDIEERFLRNKGYVHPEDSTNEPIICESCGLQFDNGSACERHRKKCIYQKTADVLSSTIGENEDNDDQLCHHCGKSFSYAAMFWKHIKTCSPAMSFDVNNKTINKQISDKQLESPPKQDTGKETAQGVTKRSDSKSPSKKTPSKSATTDSNISPIGSDFDDKMPELEKVEPIEDVKRVTRSKKSEDLTDIPILSPVSEVDATVAENSEELFVPDPHSTLPITDKKGKRKSKAKTKLEENKITLSVEVSQSRVAPIQKGTIMMNQSEMETSLETVKEEGKPIESIKRNKSRIKNDKKENEDDKKLNSDVKKESLRKRSRSTRRSLKGSEEYALPISKLEEQFAEMVNIVDDSQELPCDKFLTENVIDNQCESTEKDAIARRRVPSRGRDCKIESQRNETEPSASGTAVSDESAETESQSSQEAPTTPKKKRNPSKVSVKKLPEPIATETHKQAVVENTLKITSSRQTHVNKKKCKIQPLKAHFSNTDPTYNELDNSMEGTKVESLPDGTADNKEYHKEDLPTHEEINYPSSSSKCTKTKKKNILRTDTINNKKITTDLSIAAIIESVVLNSSFYDESETDPVYQHYVAEHSSNKNKIKTSSTDKDNEENIELNITQALIRGEEIHQENFSKSDVLIGPLEKKRKSKRFSINSMDSNIESYETRSLTSDAAFYPEEITPQEEHVAKKNKMAITSIISTNKTAIIVNSEIPTFTSDVKVAQEDATVSSFQKNKKNKSKFSSTYSNNITLDFESYDTNLTSNAEICQEGNVSNLVRKRNSKQTKIVRTNNEENMSETCNLDVEITQEGIDDASFLKVRHSSKKLKSGVFVTNTESYETSSLTANTEIDVNISVPNLDKKSKNKRASVNNKNVTMDVTVAESDTTAPEDMAESLFIKIDQFGKKSVPKRCTVKSTESYDMLLTSSAEEDSSDMSVANLNKKVNTRKNAINKKIISTNKESGVIVSESFTQNDNVAQEDIVETSFTKIGRFGKKSLTKTFKSGTNTSDIESCEKLSLEFSAEVCQSDSSVPNLTKKSKTKKITVGSKAISKNIEDNVIISNTGAFNLDVTAVQENIILFSEIEPFGKKRLPKNSTDVGLSLESCEMTFMTSDVELCQEENDKTSVPSVYKRSTNKKTPTGKGINTSEEVDVTVPETGREETNVQKVIAKTKLIRPSGKKGKNIKSLTNILNDNSDTESSEKLSLIPDANFDLVKTFAPEIESLSRRSRTRTTFDCSDVDSDVDSTQVQSLIVNVDCYQDIAQTSPSKIKNFVKENKTHATSGDISDTEISAVVSGTPISTCGVAWNRDKLSLSKIEYLGKKVKTRKRLNKSERENIEGQIVTTEVADISLSSLSLVDKKSKTKKSALSSKNIEVCETLDANVRAVLTCGVDLESESVSVEESSVPDSTDSGVYPVTKRKRNRLPETSSVSSSPLHLETKSLRKRRHHLARQASSLDSLNGATDDSLSHDHSVEDSRSHSLSDMSRIKTLDSLESVLVGISTGIVDTDILKFGNSEMKLDDISPPTPEVTRPKRGRPKKRANLSTKATKSNETSVLELDLNESMQQGYSNINDSLENSVEDYDIDEDAIPISKLRDPVFMQNFRMRQKRDEGKAEGKLGETAEIIFNNEPNSCASPASFAAIIEMMQETTTEQVEEPEQETPFTEVVSKTENKMDEYSAKESDEKSENIQDQIVDTSKSLLSQGSKEINLGIATFIGRERSARLTRWNLSYEEMYTSSDVASETDSQEFDTAPPVEPINDLTLKKSAFVQKNGRLCGKRGRKAHLGKSKHLKLRRSSKNKKLGTNKKKGFANKVISSLRGKEQTILDPSSGLSSTSVNEDYCQQEDSKIDMHEQDSLLSKNIVHSLSGDWHTSDITIDSLTSATTDTECSNIHIDGSITSLQKQLKIKFSNKVLSQNLDQSKSEVLKLKANHDLKKKKKKKKLQVTSDEQTNSNEVTTCLNVKLPKNIKKSKLKTIEFTESNETETSTASATLTSCMDEVPAEMGQISPDFDSCLSIETKPKRKSSFGSKFYCTLCCKHYSSAYNLSKHKTSASHLIKESMVLRNSGNTGNKQVHIAGDEEKDVNLLTATQDNDMLGTETPILEGSGSKISIENVDLKCNIPLNMNMVADLKNNVTIKNESEGLTEKRSSSVTEDKVLVSQELSLKTESNPEPGCTDDAVIPLEIPAAGDARQEVVSAQTEDSAVAAVCQVPVGVAPGWSLSEESMPSNDLSLLAEDTTPINIALADNYETFSTELDTQFPVAPVPVEIGCQNWQQGQSKEQIAPEQAGDNWQNDAQVKSSGDWSSGQKGKDWTEQQTKDVTWINEQPQDPCWVDQQKVPEVNWTEQQTKDWAEQKKSKEGIWASEEQAKDGNWTQPSITWPGAGSDWSAAQPCEGPGWLWPAGAGGPGVWGPGPQLVQEPVRTVTPWVEEAEGAQYYNQLQGSSSLGSIMDSVNQILDSRTANDELPPAATLVGTFPQYPCPAVPAPPQQTTPAMAPSLQELQRAMGATDEEMAILQQLGESTLDANWPLENAEIMDLDHQDSSNGAPTEPAGSKQAVAVSTVSKQRKPPQTALKTQIRNKEPNQTSIRDSLLQEYQDKEMVCPLCHRFFLGLKALQHHVNSVHGREQTDKPPKAAVRTRKSMSSLLSTTPNEQATTGPRLLCSVCRELLQDEAALAHHKEELHNLPSSKDLRVSTIRSETKMSTEGGPVEDAEAEGLKIQMSTALGGLFDRALSNLLEKGRLSSTTKDATNCGLSQLSLLQMTIKRSVNLDRKSSEAELSTHSDLQSQPSTSTKYNTALAKKCRQELVGRRSSSASNTSRDKDDGSSDTMMERPFACPICDDRFLILSTRNRHIARAHRTVTAEDRNSVDSPLSVPASTEDPSEYPSADELDAWREASPADWCVGPTGGDAEVGSFLCSDCGINFETPQDVLKHQKLEHEPRGQTVLPAAIDAKKGGKQPPRDQQPSDHSTAAVPGHRTAELGPSSTKGVPLSSPLIAGIESGQVNKVEENARTIGSNNRKSVARECNNENVGATTTVLAIKECKMSSAVNTRRCVLIANDNETGMDTVTTKSSGKSEVPPISSTRAGSRKVAVRNAAKLVSEIEEENSDVVGLGNTAENILDNKELMVEEEEDGALETPAGQTIKDISAARRNTNNVVKSVENLSNCEAEILTAKNNANGLKGICEKVADNSVSKGNIEEMSLSSESKDLQTTKAADLEKVTEGKSGSAVSKGSPSKSPKGKLSSKGTDRPLEQCEDGDTIRAKAEAALRELNSRRGRSSAAPGAKWGLKFTVSDMPKEKVVRRDGDGELLKKALTSDRFSFPLVRKFPIGTSRFASLAEKKKKISMSTLSIKKSPPVVPGTNLPGSPIEAEVPEDVTMISGDKSAFDVYEFEDEDSAPVAELGFRTVYPRHPEDKTREADLNDMDEDGNIDLKMQECENVSISNVNKIKNEIEDQSVTTDNAKEALQNQENTDMKSGGDDVLQHLNEDEHTGADSAKLKETCDASVVEEVHHTHDTENKPEKLKESIKHHRKNKIKNSHDKTNHQLFDDEYISSGEKKVALEDCNITLMNENSIDNSIEVLVKKSKKDRSKKEHKKRKSSHSKSDRSDHNDDQFIVERDTSSKRRSKTKKEVRTLEDNKVLNGNNMDRVSNRDIGETEVKSVCDTAGRKESKKHTKKRLLSGGNSSDECDDNISLELSRKTSSKHEHSKKKHKKRKQRFSFGTEMSLGHASDNHITRYDSDDGITKCSRAVKGKRKHFDDEEDNVSSDRAEEPSEKTKKAAARRRRTKSDLLISVFAKSKRTSMMNNSVSRSKSFLSVPPLSSGRNSSSSDEDDSFNKQISPSLSKHKSKPVTSSEVL